MTKPVLNLFKPLAHVNVTVTNAVAVGLGTIPADTLWAIIRNRSTKVFYTSVGDPPTGNTGLLLNEGDSMNLMFLELDFSYFLSTLKFITPGDSTVLDIEYYGQL